MTGTAGRAKYVQKTLEMAGSGWKLVEMARHDYNGSVLLENAINCWKYFEI